MDNPITKEAAPFATWAQIRDDAARMGLTEVRLTQQGRVTSRRVVSYAFICAQAEMEAADQPAARTYDVQIVPTPAGWLGITHLTPRAA